MIASKKKILLFVVFGILFMILGSYREFFFININNIMTILYFGQPTNTPIPNHLIFFSKLSYTQLYYLKYVLTVFYFSLFYVLSYFCVKSLARDKNILRWLNYSYLLMFFLCVVSMLWAYFIKVKLNDSEYTFSRWVMGIAQSPLPVLFFLAASQLNGTANDE